MKAEIIQVLASFVGSFGFAVLYNLRGKKLCMAGVSGMVPGGNLYYTMNYVLAKQWHLFYLYGQKTLLIAVAVAAGIMTASSVYGICASVWKYCKKEI